MGRGFLQGDRGDCVPNEVFEVHIIRNAEMDIWTTSISSFFFSCSSKFGRSMTRRSPSMNKKTAWRDGSCQENVAN